VTLFSEIAGGPRARGAKTAREEVAADLERICGIRRGSLLLAPEYGVDDVTVLFHSFPMIDAWSANLERTLARYERRIGRVQVSAVQAESADLTLRVDIEALLTDAGRSASTQFRATLDTQSRLSVR
jgi:type VI secretion system lysozyme-like protein